MKRYTHKLLFWNFFILQEICLDLSLWYSSRMTIKSGLNLILILKWWKRWSWWVIDEALGVNTEALWGILRNTLAPNCFLKFLHSVTNFSSGVLYLSRKKQNECISCRHALCLLYISCIESCEIWWDCSLQFCLVGSAHYLLSTLGHFRHGDHHRKMANWKKRQNNHIASHYYCVLA